MKITSSLLVGLLSSYATTKCVMSFVIPSAVPSSSSSTALLAEQQHSVSRTSFLTTAVTSLTSAVVITSSIGVQNANAAKYGSFGTDSTTGSITPQTAEIDQELLKSSSVKDAISTIQKARTAVAQVQSTLQSNPQITISSSNMIGDPYKIRESCNVINTLFDEDTQRYTDRLIRNIVQDLIEIDIAAAQKDGIERSTRRYDNVQNKLTKLITNIDSLLAFTV